MEEQGYRVLKIPTELYYPLAFELYRIVDRKIDEGDKQAKEWVEWYYHNIGFSAKYLVKKLDNQQAKGDSHE